MGKASAKRIRGMSPTAKIGLVVFCTLLVTVFMQEGAFRPSLSVGAVSPMTHSSVNLGTKYGSWGAAYDCTTCHQANSSNIMRVKPSITTPAGARSVVFQKMTSTTTTATGILGNDQRATLTSSNNVCEVCHHNTAYHQYSSSKAGVNLSHNNRKNCLQCHPHSQGFKQNCDSCHGYPPVDAGIGTKTGLASPASGATSPASAGAHAAHVTAKSMSCDTCHVNSTMPSLDNKITMGFSINNTNWPGFSGSVTTFSSFSGHSPLNTPYAFNAGDAKTTVATGSGYRNSCNVYCHANWAGSNGSLNPSWVVTDGTQKACGTCHGASAAQTPLTGSHTKHAGASALALSCDKCHGAHPDNSHINGVVKWDLSLVDATAQYKTPTGAYANTGTTGALAPSASYGSCNNLYCHSTVQGATGTGAGTYATPPTWGATNINCGSCHVDMSSDATGTGSHKAHTQASGTAFTCDVCHGAGYSASAASYPTHANGTINLSFTGTGAGTTYGKTSSIVPGSAVYSSCSTSNCHGSANNSPTWGNNTAKQRCEKCHGFRGTFSALNGATANTDAKAGAHFNHISSATYKYSKSFSCAECHANSIANATDDVKQANHFGTSPADVSFGTLGGGASATTSVVAGVTQCSNVYCHGAGMASNVSNPPSSRVAVPAWNGSLLSGAPVVGNGATTPGSGACAQCHGYPPMTATHAGRIATECTTCHTHVNASGTGFNDAKLHVDGIVQAAGDCNSCHDYDVNGATYSAGVWTGGSWGKSSRDGLNPNEGWGAHAKHINYIKGRLAISIALDPKNQTFGTGTPANVCGSCHTNLASNHSTGGSTVRTINFGDGNYKMGGTTGISFLFGASNPAYNGTSGVSSATTQKTCSNISCHYFTTPLWSTY